MRVSGLERDGAEQVGSACLLPVGEVSPRDLIERHRVDGAATAVFGRGSEAVASTDESTAAEWCVQLVGGQGDEVEMPRVVVRPHVDRAMGGELRRVDEDPAADGMDTGGQVMDRRDDAGDVRCSRHDEHAIAAGVAGEESVEILEVECPVGQHADVDGAAPGLATASRWNGVRGGWSSTTESSSTAVDLASLLIASVVFLVKITVSRSGSAPTNVADRRSRPVRTLAVHTRALWPLPRWTLA